MWGIIGAVIGVIIYEIIHHFEVKENRKHCRYDPENKCWIPDD